MLRFVGVATILLALRNVAYLTFAAEELGDLVLVFGWPVTMAILASGVGIFWLSSR